MLTKTQRIRNHYTTMVIYLDDIRMFLDRIATCLEHVANARESLKEDEGIDALSGFDEFCDNDLKSMRDIENKICSWFEQTAKLAKAIKNGKLVYDDDKRDHLLKGDKDA